MISSSLVDTTTVEVSVIPSRLVSYTGGYGKDVGEMRTIALTNVPPRIHT
jgi:hypothetical protein